MTVPPLKSLRPDSAAANKRSRGFARALTLFQAAARRVPAYRDFLKKHSIKPSSIRTAADFAQLPPTDKDNYMRVYDMRARSWDGSLQDTRSVATSSGSTGVPFFWPRGARQDIVLNEMTRMVYERIFDTRKGTTLVVISFALGQWIAGFEFYNATRWSAERGSRIAIVTPGIDKLEAVNQVRNLAGQFDRVVVAGYPPFLKDIIEQGDVSGVDWKHIDLHMLAGGEAVSDIWKDRLLERVGRPHEIRRFVTEYGMAESGVVANETPVSAVLRRSLPKVPSGSPLPPQDAVVGMYQFYPEARYFEVLPDSTLALTSDAGLPLIRYDTRDTGGIIEYADAIEQGGAALRETAREYRVDLAAWKLPFVYLFGRKDFSVSLYALNIYVENLKRALERSSHAPRLSGLFTMGVGHTDNLDQQFEVAVELAHGVEPSTGMEEVLSEEIAETLRLLNTEYAKLYASIGRRAHPKLTLLKRGQLETIPGRKHRWVKRG